MPRPRNHWHAGINVLHRVGSYCFVRAENRWHCRTKERFCDIVADIITLYYDVDVVSLTLLVDGYFISDGLLCIGKVVCRFNLSHGAHTERKCKQRVYILNVYGFYNYDILHDLLLLHQQELLLLGTICLISQLYFGFPSNFIGPGIAQILVWKEALSKGKEQFNISCTEQQCRTRKVCADKLWSVLIRTVGGLWRWLWRWA